MTSRPQRDYEAEDAFSTLKRAEDIKGNPRLHSRAMKHGRKELASHRRALKLEGKRL